MNYRYENQKFVITIDDTFANQPLQAFFDAYSLSKKTRYLYLQNHYIKINDKIVTQANTLLQANDQLSIQIPNEAIDYPYAKEACKVVYEDDFVYVAHKPVGMIIHGEEPCLANYAATYQKQIGLQAPVRYLHRLDKETSGLVLFSKIPFFQSYFDQALEKHAITRTYYAICKGKKPQQNTFTINEPIGRDRHQNNHYRISKTGKQAITNVQFLKEKDGYLLFQCTLQTGRTHQIRVHLSSMNYPIVNDSLYGISSKQFQHMGLWAKEINFMQPITNKMIHVIDIPNPDYDFFKE